MKSTLIIAHRGLSSLYPENTLIAFKKAMALGVDFIELDVYASRDGELVVIHDDILDRTTDGTGKVTKLTLKQIKKYSAGKWFSDCFKKEKVPTLKEVFKLTKKRIKLLIEIKQPGIEKTLIKIIKEYGMTDNVICGSFSLKSVVRIKKLNSCIPVAFISCSVGPQQINEILRKNINMIDIEFTNLSPERLKTFYSYGLTVGVWTLDKGKDLRRMLKMGVTAITSNYPQRVKKLVKL